MSRAPLEVIGDFARLPLSLVRSASKEVAHGNRTQPVHRPPFMARFSIVLEEVCHGNGDCVAHAG